MELILVRHALPQRQQVASGTADPALSAVGIEQAAEYAEAILPRKRGQSIRSPQPALLPVLVS